MGNSIPTDIGGFIGYTFTAPFKATVGRSCLNVCSRPWDVTCFIEHFCLPDIAKLVMISGLCAIILMFITLFLKLGICQCIVKSICKMSCAACAIYWFTIGDMIRCLWHTLSNTKHIYRRKRLRDIEATGNDDPNLSVSLRPKRRRNRRRGSKHKHNKESLDDVEAEMKSLRLELKQTMDLYSTASKEASSARQQVKELQNLRTEEERRLEEAKSSEEAAKRLAEMEAKRTLTAEMKSLKESDSFSRGFVRYREYTIEEIEEATSTFAESRKVGEGGYGHVYRGFLDHTSVSVRVLRPKAAQGRSQFQKQIEVLSCIRHPNMVLLLGSCPDYGVLVYEYMAQGSLEDLLFMRGNTPPITWQTRFRIAAEIATGLLYLHQTKPEPIVHRDLKPGNVLFDDNYVSKTSGVELARLVPTVAEYRVTSAAGTFCYIDPEYQITGMFGVKSDVYSLGIMLLQILTAKQPKGLACYVEQAIEEGTLKDMLDPAVPDWPMEEALSLAKLSLQCAKLRRKDRPDLEKEILPELNRLRDIGEESLESVFYGGSQGRSPITSQVSTSSSPVEESQS